MKNVPAATDWVVVELVEHIVDCVRNELLPQVVWNVKIEGGFEVVVVVCFINGGSVLRFDLRRAKRVKASEKN